MASCSPGQVGLANLPGGRLASFTNLNSTHALILNLGKPLGKRLPASRFPFANYVLWMGKSYGFDF